jgi:gamma-glutamyltranspeptidase / glutathione hydrolase
MLLELGVRRLALATPGADGQVQTLAQLVRRLEAGGTGLSEVLAVPRWRAVRGRLALEASFDGSVREGLAALSHRIDTCPDGDMQFGAAALAGHGRDDGVVAAADPRRETWAAVR